MVIRRKRAEVVHIEPALGLGVLVPFMIVVRGNDELSPIFYFDARSPRDVRDADARPAVVAASSSGRISAK